LTAASSVEPCQPTPDDRMVEPDAPADVDEQRPLGIRLDVGLRARGRLPDPDEPQELAEVPGAEGKDADRGDDRRRERQGERAPVQHAVTGRGAGCDEQSGNEPDDAGGGASEHEADGAGDDGQP